MVRVVAQDNDKGLTASFRSSQAEQQFAAVALGLVEKANPSSFTPSRGKPDYVVHAEKETENAAKQREDDLAGQKSGSKESMHLSSAAATQDAHDAKSASEERRARELASDALFLDLLRQIDEIDREIKFLDEQVDLLAQTITELEAGDIDIGEALGQEHVKRAIKEWEQRHPGEEFDPTADDADVKLLQILEEQRQVDSTNISRLNTKRADLVAEVHANNDLFSVDPVRARSEAEARVEAGYAVAEGFQSETDYEEIKGDASGTQDGHRDTGLDEEEDLFAESAFDGFDVGPSDRLAEASAQLATSFSVASAESTTAVELGVVKESDPAITVKI